MSIEKVVWSIVISALVWFAILVGTTVYLTTENAIIPVHVPTFQRGDCFRLTGSEEDWQTLPDGIIERVGKHSYLLLWKEQAEKHGSKYGATLEIKVFDALNTKVECPEAWITHKHKKR